MVASDVWAWGSPAAVISICPAAEPCQLWRINDASPRDCFAALIRARAPLDARTIANGFRQGARAEPAISRILASLARLSHAHTSDGRGYALRRTA